MAAKENNFNSLVSIIKIEPEEFQSRGKKLISNSDEVLRRKAKIFSDPEVCLERISLQSQDKILNQQKNKMKWQSNDETILKLLEEGNAGKTKFQPHTCCLCRKVFGSRSSLKVHLMNFHEKAPEMFCDFCPKTFRVKAQMAYHMKLHMYKAFDCNICDFQTAHKYILNNHKKTHSKQEKCKICNKQVTSLKIHLRTHQKQKCSVCSKIICKDYLQEHIKTHDDRRYKCPDCSSTFSTRDALKKHKLEQHYGGKLHRCHCGSIFKTKSDFNRHQMCHKSEKTICKICKRKFKHPQSLKFHWRKSHLKTHGSMNECKVVNQFGPFVCDKCGKKFESRHLFSKHFHFGHVKNLYFFCDLCPKSFRYKYSLEDHMHSQHSKVISYSCKVCGHKSTAKSSLKRHMLQHNPKTECKIRHKMVADLYEHMRTHVKVKCPICGKTFSKNLFAKHIKSVHKSIK